MTGDLLTSHVCRAAAVAAAVVGVCLVTAHQWLAAGLVWWLVPSLLLVGGLARAHHRRRVRYLQDEVRALGGEDRWSARCAHCGKRMRDSASIRHTTRLPSGNGWVERMDGVFHLDRPSCVAAADKVRSGS